MLKILAVLSFGLWVTGGFAQDAIAKGLDELEEPPAKSQEQAEQGADDTSGVEAEADAETDAVPAAVTASVGRTITETMYLSTSFGWVTPSRSEGDWRGAGMSDITLGYKLPVSLGDASLYGTYRYAPVAIAGKIDSNAYRGVWDMHYFGGLGSFALSGLDLIGTFEIGYVLVYLDSVDGIDLEPEHAESGVSVALGGGADWEVLGEKGFKLGPRMHLGFGGFTTFQFGAAATFMF